MLTPERIRKTETFSIWTYPISIIILGWLMYNYPFTIPLLSSLFLGMVIGIVVHEFIHYFFLWFGGAKLRGILFMVAGIGLHTKGDEHLFQSNKKAFIILLSPFVLGLLLIPFFHNTLIAGFGLINILGSMADIGTFIDMLRTPRSERSEKAGRNNALLFNSLRWKKYIKIGG